MGFQYLEKLVNKRGKKYESYLNEFVNINNDYPLLSDLIKNHLIFWKDYYRPTLISLSCEAVGGNSEDAIPAIILITITGAGIGLHDDIIDDTKLRSGSLTFFGVHGIKKSLLLGDLLIIKMISALNQFNIHIKDSNKFSFILKEFEDYLVNICEGELMEINCHKNLDISIEYLDETLWRLGLDCEICTKLGGYLGNGSNAEINALSSIGRKLGYLWRLHDDIEDTMNIRGKINTRLNKESIPLPILLSSKKSKNNRNELYSIINNKIITAENASRIVEICYDSLVFNFIDKKLDDIFNDSKNDFESLKESKYRNALFDLVKKVVRDIKKMYS
jgi:geranylgeranyl pyrophosphate synthase